MDDIIKKERRIIPISSIELRHLWLENLGGIQTVSVKNKEWLTLLSEDTRNSLMIEGHFVSKAEIEEILKNPKYTKTDYKVLGYFDAAVASYELAFQQYKSGEFNLSKSIIRQIHSLMFRGDPYFSYTPGEWRKGEIKIVGSSINTPSPFYVEKYIDNLVKIVNEPEKNLVRKIAIIHDMFEQIHPFPDGNGRVGRILLNFILIGHGLPNIAIKGSEKDKKNYIIALEEADPIISKILTGKNEKNYFSKPLLKLENLINRSLAVAMDIIICNRFNKIKELVSINDAAKMLNRPANSIRVACSQKKYICTKINNEIKTHPILFKPPMRDSRV
jgi:Fic family protein